MLLHKLKRMNLSKDYADFIQQLQWNYFATCRPPYDSHHDDQKLAYKAFTAL